MAEEDKLKNINSELEDSNFGNQENDFYFKNGDNSEDQINRSNKEQINFENFDFKDRSNNSFDKINQNIS